MLIFNPEVDVFILQIFSRRRDEKINKLALQKKLGLPEDKNTPLSALSQICLAKGIDLITEKFSQRLPVRVLGTGEEKYEEHLKNLAKISATVQRPNRFDEACPRDLRRLRHIPCAVAIRAVRTDPDDRDEIRRSPARRKTGGLTVRSTEKRFHIQKSWTRMFYIKR